MRKRLPFVAVILAAMLLIWLGVRERGASPLSGNGLPRANPSEYSDPNATGTELSAVTGNTFNINTQPPSEAITLQFVGLEARGFAAVHENKDGGPGALLGASALLQKGVTMNVQVPLSRKARAGEKLFVKLYTDDGDGTFEEEKDPGMKTDGGQFIITEFSIAK